MTRRRLVVLSSALALLALGLVAAIAVLGVTQTEYGRQRVKGFILSRIASNIQGSLHVGRIGGSLLGGVTIDSLEIRGVDDSLLIATGPISVTYDLRDLIDRRILVSHLSIERPVIRLHDAEDGGWNYKEIFRRPSRRGPGTPGRGYGDYIIIDSLDIRDARVELVMPWQPADSLRGARRDSAVRFNLARDDAEIRRAGERFTRTWRWTDAHASFSHARIAQPDSAGQLFVIGDLRVVELDPPFRFSNVRGVVRRLSDSLWLDLPHFDLPGSTGSGKGKIVWGSGLPTRYAIRIIGDSVSLADIAWVYPTMPTTGSGRMRLDINNERDPRIVNYVIHDMDVRTTHSRLLGDMTYGVGGPVLRLTDVDLEAAPVDFRLIRQFNGKPFPVEWAGTLTGTVRASGGPLHRFDVEDARLVFHDANVAGAVSRLAGRGQLDILDPAFTSFRGFTVDAERVDLRTPRHLFPLFPPLEGTVSGVATLDSVWTDVRFRDASLVHADGPGETSMASGRGRVTLTEDYLIYDLVLDAERVAFTTLARSFPELPLRGTYRGPVRVQGTVEDMGLIASLSGPAGTLAVNGQFDFYPPGFGMRGLARLEGVNLRTLLARADLPATHLNVSMDADLRGDSFTNLDGRAEITSQRSQYDWLRIHPSRASIRLADGVLHVDSLALETTAARIGAHGSLGLIAGRGDSLTFVATVDSLGGLREAMGLVRDRPVANGDGTASVAASDSLAGLLWLSGSIRGSLDTLGLHASLSGTDLVLADATAGGIAGEISLEHITSEPRGRLDLRLDDSVTIAGVRLLDLTAGLRFDDLRSGRLELSATSENGPTARLAAELRVEGDTTTALVETLAIAADSAAPWRLASPALLRLHDGGWQLDSLELRRPGGGRLVAVGVMPRRDPIDVRIVGEQLPLTDVGALTQARAPLGGAASFAAAITGTRLEPRYTVTGDLRDARMGDVAIEQLRLVGRYEARELFSNLELFRRNRAVLSASLTLPVDLALVPIEHRLLDAPLRGKIRTDSVELGILETFTSAVSNATGRIDTDIDLAGTWEQPALTGRIGVAGGMLDLPGLGVRLEQLDADVALAGDSLHIRRLTALSRHENSRAADTASLTGFAKFADFENPMLGLTFFARDFRLINRRGVGRLDVSTPWPGLQLAGRLDDSRLAGSLVLERGQIVIPELVQKRPIDLSDPELLQQLDTTLLDTRRYLPSGPNRFVQGLQLQGVRLIIGDEVWLRSSEANIKLGGQVAVAKGRTAENERARLALEGTLNAVRGTYKLNLGLVQRTFEVDTGRVVFYGDAELNPALDISALHTVRQVNRQDVRIRVHIGGTLDRPELTLSSAEGLPISQPVLLSYLVTGRPTLDVGSETAAASVLLPTVGSWFGTQLSGVSGGLFDYVQIQTADFGERSYGDLWANKTSIFEGTSLGVGRQIGNRTFISATAGLCKIVERDVDTQTLFQEVLGFKVEHRFNHGFSLEVGSEPQSNALLCNATSTIRRSIEVPRQFGFDLFRAWTF